MGWFDFKKPCDDCPFRRSQAGNYGLGHERLREIFEATAFECRKTTGVMGVRHEPQQCAGLIALQHAEGKHNQITQVAMRLMGYDPAVIDTNDTFQTYKGAYDAHSHQTHADKTTQDSDGNPQPR